MAEQNNTGTRTPWLILGGIGVFAVLGLCIVVFMAGVFLLNSDSDRKQTAGVSENQPAPTLVVTPAAVPAPASVVVASGEADYETLVLENIYQKVNPSVVNVDVLAFVSSGLDIPVPNPDDTNPPDTFPQLDPQDLLPQGQGSGFIWDNEGHIVTNAHVVEGADQVQIGFSDGTVTVAEVLGIDLDSDLAVLEIDPDGYELAPVALGNVDDVRVGMRVAAIGNPFGFQGTLTSGIVSAIGRSIPALTNFSIPEAIQTDAAINPGNSGGPLLNERGEVIGVNAQIRSTERANSGVGFAIPVSIVKRVIPALIAEGSYEHSYIGISGMTFSPICADDLGLPKTIRGAYVIEVFSNTPAARGGIRGGSEESGTHLVGICPDTRGGDLITAIDNQPVKQFDDILIYLERYTSPGDKVVLTVLRDGKEVAIEIELAARPQRVGR
jgi:2-alkenal reductase